MYVTAQLVTLNKLVPIPCAHDGCRRRAKTKHTNSDINFTALPPATAYIHICTWLMTFRQARPVLSLRWHTCQFPLVY